MNKHYIYLTTFIALLGAFTCSGMDIKLISVKNESDEPIRVSIAMYSDPVGDVPFPIGASTDTRGIMIYVPGEETYILPKPMALASQGCPEICLTVNGTVYHLSENDILNFIKGPHLVIKKNHDIKWVRASEKLRSTPLEANGVESE